MFQKVKAFTAPATPMLAKEFQEMTPAPGDRGLRPKRYEKHKRAHERGHLRSPSWCKAYCRETKETYRCNGNHTSRLFLDLGEDELRRRQYEVFVEVFECDTLQDVAHLYNTYDSPATIRNQADMTQAYAASNSHLSTISRRKINAFVSGLAYAYGPLPGMCSSAELLDGNELVVLWLDQFFVGSSPITKAMFKKAVISAMILTYERDRAASDHFWRAVRDGYEANPIAASRTLQLFLLSASNFDPREVHVKCIHAWNAYRRGETLAILKFHPSAPNPKPI
jgi:hypothetical protein